MEFAAIMEFAITAEFVTTAEKAADTDTPAAVEQMAMKSEYEINNALNKYADTVRRICVVYLKNREDTEDIFQNVFLKYALRSSAFESEEHEKAWLIRVTINECKDFLKNIFRRDTVPIDDYVRALSVPDSSQKYEVLDAVLSLPQKYRDVVYLHYYEGFTAPQISELLGKNVNTVYTLLQRSRQMLREKLGGEE